METKKNEHMSREVNETVNGTANTKTGLFKSADKLKEILPQDIYEIIFESEKLDNSINFSSQKANRAYLNNLS